MTKLLEFPARLEAAGVNVITLDGWDQPANPGYLWRENDGEPAGFMHHHTATQYYTPNRTKANGYAGLIKLGGSRVYQEDYGDTSASSPVFVIANAYPAPVSSGAGDKSVLRRVRKGVEIVGRQGSDTPGWYGNTHYYNVEWILDGVGAWIDEAVWEMMVVVCDEWNDLYGRTPNHHIGHYHHTRRKIDLYDGRDANADETIRRLREDMDMGMKWADIVADATWAKAYEDDFIQGNPDVMPDYYFADGPATEDEKKNAYNVIMQNQMEATK